MVPRHKYKLVVIGDASTGKTSLIARFMYDTFESSYKVTIGIDFASKNVYLEDRVVRLQLWDTGGQERFRSLIPSYIRDSSVALVVYDIANRLSYQSTGQWIKDIRTERGDDAVIMLVGNKSDLSEARQVSTEEAQAFAAKHKLLFIEASAKTGDNVKQLFHDIARALPGQDASDPHGASSSSSSSSSSSAVKITVPLGGNEPNPSNANAGGYCGCS